MQLLCTILRVLLLNIWDFNCISEDFKPNTIAISQGAMYTILSRTKSRDKVKLVNFEWQYIKLNTAALQETLRMREEALSSWHHTL